MKSPIKSRGGAFGFGCAATAGVGGPALPWNSTDLPSGCVESGGGFDTSLVGGGPNVLVGFTAGKAGFSVVKGEIAGDKLPPNAVFAFV